MSLIARLGPCKKVFSGEFIGKSTVPQYKFICEQCLVEGTEPFIFGPPFEPPVKDPVKFSELVAKRESLGGQGPPCAGDYGNPAGVFFAGQFGPGHL
jgi:hypothetical protein